jgi:hypothetical protein
MVKTSQVVLSDAADIQLIVVLGPAYIHRGLTIFYDQEVMSRLPSA